MIHPKAVRAFRERKRDSFVWMKTLKSRELDEELDRLGFRPARHDKPLMKHQKVSVIIGLAYPQFAFFLDMGSGKTRIALELLYHRWKRNEFDVGMVLAPSQSALIGWENQIKEWRIKMPYLLLPNSPSEYKWELVEHFTEGLILVTYAGFTRMMCQLEEQEDKDKDKLVPIKKRVTQINKLVGAIVADESTKLMHKKSLAYRLMLRLTK